MFFFYAVILIFSNYYFNFYIDKNKCLCYYINGDVMDKIYFCIDLKTFFASVECVERGLDPFKVDLIVADPDRKSGSICLAISPSMKAKGVRNRCRVFEIPKNIIPIVAKPRMKKYIEYSAFIYGIYLKFISKEDIHVYSIDEAFLDVTSYLKMYNCTKEELAAKIMNEIYKETGITAACGIGTNLYLAKIALDIIAKQTNTNIGYLDEEKYIKELSFYTPLTDFWHIGEGIQARLNKLHLKNMHDISECDENILYKEFGVNAKILIDHSKGIEPTTIKDIKNYKAKNNSMSNSQILFRDYNYKDARVVLVEMIDNLVQELVKKKLVTESIGFSIGYSKDFIKSLKVNKKLENATNSFQTILKKILEEYDYQIIEKYKIRRISIYFNNIHEKRFEQLDLFGRFIEDKREEKIENTINNIKEKYGKNSILRGISYLENANQRNRNNMIGGHNAN